LNEFSSQGGNDIIVDATILCFINHGCDGSNNFGHDLKITEREADPDIMPDEVLRYRGEGFIYNPSAERQPHFYSTAFPRYDVPQGEELFDNYLGMTGYNKEGWAEDVISLKEQCSGGVGPIKEFLTTYNKTLVANNSSSELLTSTHLHQSVHPPPSNN
jgi:hypothetical protein